MALKFELSRDLCTVYLRHNFHNPIFNRSEVIMFTNKQTDSVENIHLAPLCCAGEQQLQIQQISRCRRE